MGVALFFGSGDLPWAWELSTAASGYPVAFICHLTACGDLPGRGDLLRRGDLLWAWRSSLGAAIFCGRGDFLQQLEGIQWLWPSDGPWAVECVTCGGVLPSAARFLSPYVGYRLYEIWHQRDSQRRSPTGWYLLQLQVVSPSAVLANQWSRPTSIGGSTTTAGMGTAA